MQNDRALIAPLPLCKRFARLPTTGTQRKKNKKNKQRKTKANKTNDLDNELGRECCDSCSVEPQSLSRLAKGSQVQLATCKPKSISHDALEHFIDAFKKEVLIAWAKTSMEYSS